MRLAPTLYAFKLFLFSLTAACAMESGPVVRATQRPGRQRSLNRLLPPTPRQEIAIGNLHYSRLSFKDQSIFDWLEIVRSARDEIQQRTGVRPLTEKEFIALAALSSADDENIREWFRNDHSISKTGYPHSNSKKEYDH